MQKVIKRQMIKALLIFFLQLLIASAVYVAIALDLFDYHLELLIGVMASFIVIDVLLFWSMLTNISKSKYKTDLRALDIVGEDIQEAYIFGKIGLIVTDENSNIIWVNDQFASLESTIMDINIFEWREELKELKDLDDGHLSESHTIRVEIEGKLYEVKLLKEANLFIFKDITEYNAVVQYSKEHAPVIGIISIDNFSDLESMAVDRDGNDIVFNINQMIIDYARKFNLLVKKIKNDSYFVVCDQKAYEQLIKDRFSIMNKVKKQSFADTIVTLSIGFSNGFDDVVKLSEMASDALDVALSRGGDQAVLSPYGGNFVFIGGSSEAKTNKSRVKTRALSSSLASLIQNAKNIVIMGHLDADLDAIGSALGLYSFAKMFKNDVHIVYDEKLVETKTKKAFKDLFTKEEIQEMTYSIKQANYHIGNNSLLILTDVHRPSIVMASSVLDKADRVAIIDHHRRGEEYVDSPVFVQIEPSASSASELVTEIIKYSPKHVDLDERKATFMLAGILLDTNYYRQKTGATTYDASLILKEYGADNQIADDFLKEEYEEYALKNKILSNSITPYYGVIVAMAEQNDIISKTMLAVVASEAIQIKGVNACFVIGRTSIKETAISARSDGTVNVQMLMEKLNGGGHFTAAASQFSDQSINEVCNLLKGVLELYLNDARTQQQQ